MGFATADGTAKAGTCGAAGADYLTTSSALTFTGQVSQTGVVQICGDSLSEGD